MVYLKKNPTIAMSNFVNGFSKKKKLEKLIGLLAIIFITIKKQKIFYLVI